VHADVDPERLINGAIFDVDYSEMVVVKDIPFYSLCEHHLLPFFGTAAVAYIPRGRVIGLSKIPRVVETYARRLQVQERLTQQIADFLQTRLDPQGVGVFEVPDLALRRVVDGAAGAGGALDRGLIRHAHHVAQVRLGVVAAAEVAQACVDRLADRVVVRVDVDADAVEVVPADAHAGTLWVSTKCGRGSVRSR